MRRLYWRGLTTTLGGNISTRLPDATGFLITPSGSDKAMTRASQIGALDFACEPLDPGFKPSIEASAHAAVYRVRELVGAVIHAHPATVCAFAATSAEIDSSLIIEARELLGTIAYVPEFEMGSKELAEAIGRTVAGGADCVVMRGHGALTVGKSLVEAFERMEVLENAAGMTISIRSDPELFS
jgi:L-fuculose-phosphate aldolase